MKSGLESNPEAYSKIPYCNCSRPELVDQMMWLELACQELWWLRSGEGKYDKDSITEGL